MPRYVVERTYASGAAILPGDGGAAEATAAAIVERNSDHGVTWLHSYVTLADDRSFCVYDAPSPEAIRKAAARNGLPVDRITEVRVLDPYFHHAASAPERTGDALPANDGEIKRAG